MKALAKVLANEERQREQERNERIQSAYRALAAAGPASLIEIVRSSDAATDRRKVACRALGDLRCREATSSLIAAVRSGDEDLAWWAARALVAIRSRGATRKLIDVIRTSRHEPSREASVYALWGLNDARAKGILFQLLRNPKEGEKIRSLATEALGFLPRRAGISQALVTAVTNPSAIIRYSALCAIGEPTNSKERRAVESLLTDQSELPGGRVVGKLARELLEATSSPSLGHAARRRPLASALLPYLSP